MRVRERVLTFFLSNGGSLIRWQQDGILSREILLYLHFLRANIFDRIRIFSYHSGDAALVKRLAAVDPVYHRIDIIGPPRGGERKGLGRAIWSLWGPLRYRSVIRRSVALKTNQVSGAWSAILSHWITGRPFIFRMGYLLSRRFRKNGDHLWSHVARVIERIGCARASQILVSAHNTAEHLGEYKSALGKIIVTPTYVDVKLFRPIDDYDFSKPIISVGRLHRAKNLANLISACAEMQCELVLIGKGEMEQELKSLAETIGAPVRFIRQVDNDQLAKMLTEHAVFAIPSLHEGLPKVLIEAMACGLVCVGSNIPGVTDLIEDGKTGYLIDGFEAEEIANALRRARNEQRADIGQGARRLIEEQFSLEHYAAREAKVYEALA